MDPLSIGLTLGSTIFGGIFGGMAEAEKEKKIREQVQRAQALARQGLMSSEQLASRLRDIDRLFNKRLISTLNSTAFGGRRLANANVAGASVAGQLGAQSEASKVQYTSAVDDRNAQIYQYMAGLEAGAPVFSPLEGAVTGALGGAQAGISIANLVNRKVPEVPVDPIGGASGYGYESPTRYSPSGGFGNTPQGLNPTLPPPISDEDIFGLGILKRRSLF